MELRRTNLKDNPFDLLKEWLQTAEKANIAEPNAMVLATASSEATPSLRTVLLKEIETSGLIFYTDYRSRKSEELEANAQAALLFTWPALDRQLCVEGRAEKVAESQSDTYFARRSREGQLGRWASYQGQPVPSREDLDERFRVAEERFTNLPVPRPIWWGGWRIIPHRFEFWQGRLHRLHDRFEYLLEEPGTWRITRLSP